MRLGTKSCAECRRRKVRCVFPPNSSVCHGCELHQTPCRAQQPRPRDSGRPGQAQIQELLGAVPQFPAVSQAQLAADNAALRRRVAELEGLIGSICDALEPGSEDSASTMASPPTTADINTRAIQVIQNLKSRGFLLKEMTPSSQNYNSFGSSNLAPLPSDAAPSLLSPNSLDHESTSASSEYADKAASGVDAPLIHLFRDALLIRETEGELYDDPEDPSMVYLMKESISSFKPPLPDAETLHRILKDSQKFWAIWPPYYFGPDMSNAMHTTSLDVAEAYISQIFNYSRGVEFCTALLFLTLCIQQLPRQWGHDIISPNISRQVLIDTYLRFANVLLSVQGEESIDVVQCHVLLHKVLINMGRPLRAWIAIRHAISAATVIGLDRLGASASIQRKTLWAHTWYPERQLCMTLGFPSAVSPLSTKEEASMVKMMTPAQTVLGRSCFIMGRVIERNLNSDSVSYATTVQLDQDMEELKRLFPREWSEPHRPNTSLEDIDREEVAKIFFYSTLKHVHLPYMLKARSDRRYEHSRLSAMEACRDLIRVYLRLRGTRQSQLIQCELLDFTAFGTAITLILGILSRTAAEDGSSCSLSDYAEDWQLLETLVGELKQTDEHLVCTVAKQGAEVLETLIAASFGTYVVQDDFTLVVPYFGRLRISQGKKQDNHVDNHVNTINAIANTNTSFNGSINDDGALLNPNTESTLALSSLPQKQVPGDAYYMPQLANTIEFSSNEFLNSTLSDFDFQMDLSQDWCSIVDTGAQYDWNQMFNTNAMGLP